MAKAREIVEWDRFGEICAMLANVNRPDKKARVWKAHEFGKYAAERSGVAPKRSRAAIGRVGASALKDVFKHGIWPRTIKEAD